MIVRTSRTSSVSASIACQPKWQLLGYELGAETKRLIAKTILDRLTRTNTHTE